MVKWRLTCFILLAFAWTGTAKPEADPVVSTGDLGLLSQYQSRQSIDPRPRLSASQQAQILSDVQQHQQRFPNSQELTDPRLTGGFPTSTPYSSLAKYKVDRTKQQQQLQQLLQQQQQVQQLLQQQQQKINQQLGQNQNFLNTAQTQYQPITSKQRQQYQSNQQQFGNQYQNIAGGNGFQGIPHDLNQPFFTDEQSLQLQTYLEKQRELELLQKQRQQLLVEQQELRRQQELLRLQQLQALTSTTPAPVATVSPAAPVSSSTLAPVIISTMSSPLLLSSPTSRRITPSEAELFLKAIANHQKKFSSTTAASPTIRSAATTKASRLQEAIPDNLLTLMQEQQEQHAKEGKPKPQIKVIYQTERPSGKVGSPKGRSSQYSGNSERDLLLKQLKIALAQSGEDEGVRNVTTRDLILPNGKKLQVIHAPNGLSSIGGPSSTRIPSTTTIKPPKAILEELTKGVLPPGADFEVIRQKSDGNLEEVGKQSLPAKKVTFVVLEEQPDGSYKVQGIKGNVDKESSDVDSIVERIKKGELKLPPSSTRTATTPSAVFSHESNGESGSVSTRISSQTPSSAPTTFRPTTLRSTSKITEGKSTSDYYPFVTTSPNFVSSTDKYVTSASSFSGHVYNSVSGLSTSPRPTSPEGSSSKYSAGHTRSQFVPTMVPVNNIISSSTSTPPTTFSHPSSYIHYTSRSPATSPRSIISSTTISNNFGQNDNTVFQEFERTTVVPQPTTEGKTTPDSLASLLRREGLFAMAKYLRQSGLDTVLNETGPYTIFVPTDKAFRTLLVQLGGPEKAEQKFKDNPRLLSGLLLHHVIPGAFRIDSLQDEMTGVSLAGTQLRVNEYAMHDHEWNDVKVTTINGARVAPNKRDIEIPQGIAHAVDRVMFPLPVGDLVQTLQADRERRFTTFLKMLHVSGLEDTLAGPKTFTIFAPTDAAFATAATKQGTPIWTEADGPEAAKTIISKHVVPTTLYTAGMRYYIQKDTLRPQMPLHIHKNGGRVRVNEAHVVTHNVPATNGVLHAIDGVL